MLSVASPAAARTIAVVTYSIVARDPQTGELGAAVQSHWFAVGAVVPWARPGVGAVVTQAFADITYGPRALDLLASGVVPADVLRQLTAADSAAASRQVAIVDVRDAPRPTPAPRRSRSRARRSLRSCRSAARPT